MRNPERINIIISLLRELWHQYPDMRFGQLFDFIRLPDSDGFYEEDSDWLVILADKLGVEELLDDSRIIQVFQENYYLSN
jgi:uncharacterized protein YihD (DUF1040 family)